MADALYIVVQHPKKIPQKWHNVWSGDDCCIQSIETTRSVAERCQTADVVYVHRGHWRPKGGKYSGPIVSCAVRVDKVEKISGAPERWIVRFRDAVILGVSVKRRLHYPNYSYFAPAPETDR